MDKAINIYKSGVHNLLDEEIIPEDAASSSSNWYTKDGRIKLIPGRTLEGAQGVAGIITGEIFGYKVDGSKVHWRKAGTKIQYLNGTTWTDVVTGLTSTSDYAFSNYSSLAGTFTFAFGIDGIYKFHNAVPGSFCSMYDSAKNFKGLAFINKGRTILWNRSQDRTGLYGSKIDTQNSTVYTTVTGEVLADTASGILTFKSGGAARNCFGVSITDTSSGEVFTDNYLGVLTGSLGGSGTINYITGAFTTNQAGAGTATYQWENSNTGSLTDFTKSATRLAGEGFQFPQDEGGDAILNVLIGADNAYYSLKEQSVYRLAIDSDDTTATNEVYRRELGIPSYRAGVSMQLGIVFINTANPERPELTILEKNPIGGEVLPRILFPHFKFSNYEYDDCTIDTYDKYVLVACKTPGNSTNNVILLCDIENKTVDITNYAARTFAKNDGDLFIGSSITESVYMLYNGYDDDGSVIENEWIGKGEIYDSENLKKYRKFRLMGNIAADQSYEVYVNYDGAGKQLVGTVLGSGSYVDYTSPQAVGANLIGSSQIGGNDISETYPYYVEIKLKKVPKFRKRQMSFKALGFGYVDINSQYDLGIDKYEAKIPSRFRQKENVSLDGETLDMDNPEY